MRQSPVAYYRSPTLQVIRRSNPEVLRAAAISFCILMAINASAVPTETVNRVSQIQSILRAQQDAGLQLSLIWRKILAMASDCEHWLTSKIGNRKSQICERTVSSIGRASDFFIGRP
jgi:hypothetical protein